MNDILFGNNNTEVVKRLSKRYFRKNKIRNLAAILAIALTAFLFTSVTTLAFSMASSLQLSMQMQKGSKADGTLGYMTEEQYEQLVDSDFVEQAGHRRVLTYASNTVGHAIEINYADSVQQELTFCTPTHGKAPQKANEITTTDLALENLGIEPKIGATVPVEFEVRGQAYHYDMVLSGWWEASNDSISLMIVSEAFVKENPELFQNTYAADREMAGLTFSEVVLKNKGNVKEQLEEFVHSIGGNSKDMSAENFILCTENEMTQGLASTDSIVFAAGFILLFLICGYLLIYNIFDISVMQDVRQYGLLRTIGMSSRQIKKMVRKQAVWLTLIGLPIGLTGGFFVGWLMLPFAMKFFTFEHQTAGATTSVSVSPIIFLAAALFTVLTVYISTRKPSDKAAKISPLEAIRYTEQENHKKKMSKRRHGAKLSGMAFANFGRNKRRAVFIVTSLLLCVVMINSAIIISQSTDEEKLISRSTKTDYTVYNSIVANIYEGFQYHSDELSAAAVETINQQKGIENGRYFYRNTLDDTEVLVDYGFGIEWEKMNDLENGGIDKFYKGYGCRGASKTDDLVYGNIAGASEHFFDDLKIFEGEKDRDALKEKMQTGEYVIVGCGMDKLTGEPVETPLTEPLEVGDSISFYKNGECFKTCTILAKAVTVGTEEETNNSTTSQVKIGGDAPFVYMTDRMFRQIYENPTLFSYGFDVSEGQEAEMNAFLTDFTDQNKTVAYTSTGMIREQMKSLQNMILMVCGMIAAIMAFAGLINFTNMMITSMIARSHEFATMRSIGMTYRQLKKLMVYEGVYYAIAADIFGCAAAAVLAVTILKSALNSPSMWFFTLKFTIIPAIVVGIVYLILAIIIPLLVVRFFHRGTVVEQLRGTE